MFESRIVVQRRVCSSLSLVMGGGARLGGRYANA